MVAAAVEDSILPASKTRQENIQTCCQIIGMDGAT